MAKQLNVNLSFTADSTQAKAQLRDLQNSLKQITADASKSSGNNFGITKDIAQATSKVAELQSVLEDCKTAAGGLDLGKFSQSLQKNNTSIHDYATSLAQLGPTGEQAFAKLARSITQAEVPLRKSNGILSEFAVSLKNTARWQISSSVLHGFMSTIQSAYGYAKDLNESLNSIRIVTGQSVEQMAAFAEKANKAAQALSTTTTAYTDAALIFYQQGLGDKEVEERTNTVIKMANVTGDAASEVSSYMTAIWNNFDDGSESLEHYADVITALGASTASSSAEIAAGLEKFASVAETIGLSYDYSTAALATIVANTRQSADTVGTGLRTIFSRLQGLTLGETLDDGTDLNKYSKALKTVGVDILDASGNMKNMDTILTDLAGKWDNLSKAQQTALAQTVGGVRQYTNLIALMDNWDDMEKNLATAGDAEGSLQEQADIYAESWEAAQKRVKASAQAIYDSLLDDKFFISITNGFSKFLNTIENTIKALGGLPGVLSVISGLLLKIYGNEMIAAMQRWKENFQLRSDDGLTRILEERRKANEELRQLFINSADNETLNQTKGFVYTEQANLQDTLITKQQQLLKQGTSLTEEEQRRANIMLDINEQMGQRAINAAKDLQTQENINKQLERQAQIQIKVAANKTNKDFSPEFKNQLKNVKQLQVEYGTLQSIEAKINSKSNFKDTVTSLEEMSKAAEKAGISFDGVNKILESVADGSITDIEQLKNSIENAMLEIGADAEEAFLKIESSAQEAGVDMEKFTPILNQMRQSFAQTGSLTAEQIQTLKDYGINVEEVSKKLLAMNGKLPTIEQGIVSLGRTLSTVSMAINSIKGLFDTWNNEDMSFGEKLIATFTTLGMVIPMVTSAFNKQNMVQLASVSYSIAAALGFNTEALAAIKAGAATASFGATLWTVLWPIGLVMAAIAALVGVIALFINMANEPTAAEKHLNETTEAAKRAKKAYEDAKTAADELNNAFDEYGSVLKTFQECTMGTEEWKNAMQALNEQVISLIEKYPELQKYLQTGEYGELIISQEGLDATQSEYNKRRNAALMDSTMKGIEQSQAQVSVDRESAEKALYNTGLHQDSYAAHGIIGAMDQMGGTLASRESDVNLALNSMEEYLRQWAENQVNNFSGLQKGDTGYEDAINSYLSSTYLFDENGNKIAEEFAYQAEVIRSALEDTNLSSAIQNYADSMVSADTQASASVTALTASLLSDREDLNDAAKSLAGKYVQDDAANIEKQLKEEEFANHSKGTDSDALAENTWRRYQAATGHNNWKLQDNAIQETDGERKYGYIDENGDKKTIDFDDMASIIAAYEALERVGESGDKAAETLANLDKNVSKSEAEGIRGFLTSNSFNDMTASAFKSMQDQLIIDNNGNASSESIDDYLMKAFGVSSTDDLVAILGENYQEKFNEAQKLYSGAMNSIVDGLSEQAKIAYDSIQNKDNFNINNQQTVANLVQDAFIANGREGAQAIADQINLAFENGATVDDITDFTAALNGIDWKTASIADFRNALNNVGIDVVALGIDIDAIFEAMTDGSSRTLSSIQDNYKKIQDIVKGLQSGDAISDKDYNTLVSQLGADVVDGYFSVMADGTHRLVGDAEDFYRAITEVSRQQMLDNISNANNLSGSLGNTSAARMNGGNIGTQETSTAAVAYLQTLQLTEEETAKLAEIQDAYNQTGTYTAENMAKLDELMTNHQITEEQFKNLIEQNNIVLRENSEALLSSATSLAELDGLASQVAEASGGAVYGYAEALIGLASQYDNCTQEIEKYQQALTSGNEATIAAAQDSLRASITIGELSKKYNLVAEDVETQARLLRANRKELDLTEEEAARLAVANQRMNRGVETLNKNFKDWKKVLNSADHTTQDYAETLNDALDALADLTGAVDAASIPLDFLDNTTADGAKHLEWMEKAAKGDVQAINLLGSALAIASVEAMQLDESFSSAFAEATNTNIDNIGNKFNELQGIVSNAMTEIHNAIQSGMSVEEIQNKINDMGTGWVNALNQMAIATGMSVDQMNSLLNQLGVQAQVEVADVEQKMKVPTYTEYSTITQTAAATYDPVTRQMLTPPSWTRQTYTVPGPSIEVDGVVQVAQISTEGNPMSPAVKYTGTGGSSRGGGVSPSSTSSKGGGGGGSKGSAPKYNEEKHKNTKDEKERYHVIKNQLEDLTSQYENISKAKDKAFGAAKLANLNKEISAQKKLTQANKEYLSEIEKYLATDKSAVKALGANIDANGTITNYDALVQKAVNEYNAAVDAFNRATTDDEGAKKAFEAAKERYDEFMKTISQYEETQDLYKKQMQQVLDDIMTEQSLLLERTQLEVELKLNVSEDALKYLEYMMDNIENKAYDCAEAFGYLNGMTQEYFKTAEALEGGLRSLFANQGLTDTDFQKLIEGDTATYTKLMDMLSSGGTADLSDGLQQSEIDAAYGFTAEDVDTIRDYVSQLIEANQNLQEIRQTVHEQILTIWDEWNEKLDDGIAKIEHLQSITESYQNIIDIVGQKNLGVSNAFMSKMRQQSIDQANDKLEAEKARYESLKKARDDAYSKFEEQRDKGILSPEEIKLWEDSLKKMDEDVQSASESFQSAWEDALSAANEAFEAAVDQIIQAYDDAAAGLMGSMSDLQDAFDRRSDISSQYLADYEKIYQLTKLNRDLENSIDSTNNTKAKAELLELQSKINAYEEAGIDISKYQMEQLRQEYELKKAQIELEESQEAKSQVQMTRDADGNYSYVYTANADDVAKAEQNYEDKLHQMQESNANYINDLQSNMIQMEQDYQDKVQEIMKDTSLTAEERMVKLNELNQYYDEKMKFYMSEAELWEENSQRLYEEDWMNYAAATGYKISSEEEWLDHWNETQLSILTGFGSLEEYQTNHNMNVANLLLSSSDAFATWQTNIEMAMQNAGTSMADFEEDATEVLDTVAEESEKTKDSVVDMADKATSAIGEVVDAVVEWESQYSATVQKMLTWNNALITSFNQLIAGWSAVQNSANSSGAGSGNGNDSSNGSGNGSSNSRSGSNSSSTGTSSSSSAVDNSDKVAGVAAAIWLDGAASGWGDNPTRAARLKEKGVAGAQAYLNAHGSNGDIYADWASKKGQLRKYYYGSFDTGGYTGEWGLDGKFAMLHEKELVLNKEDTAHFLQAIDIVRQISDMIDLNALSSAGGLSSLLAATASSSSQKLEQQVTIHAEFPNVTDKDQITEAFTDLVNLASQYANRK